MTIKCLHGNTLDKTVVSRNFLKGMVRKTVPYSHVA